MPGSDRKHNHLPISARHSVAIIATALVLAVKIAVAQDLPSAVPTALPGISTTRLPGSSGLFSFSGTVVTAGRPGQVRNAIAVGFADGGDSAAGRPRRITLEQVKQSANRMTSPLAYMSQLSVEAAKQHRLGVQADYFPKFGATFMNLHA